MNFLVIPASYPCNVNVSKIANCPPAILYAPYNFYTRYPPETTKFWNLKNLLTLDSWLAYLTTIIIVIFSLKLSSYFGQRLGLKTITEEIALVPFRFLYFCLLIDIIFFLQNINY